MEKLKQIDFNKGEFTANGVRYLIEGDFSIERYALYQKFQIELGFNVTFEQMFAEWENVVKLANKQLFSDIVITAYNISRGMMKLEEKEPHVLKMCALFINAENEDRRRIDESMITKKINDWKEEGIRIADFFTLALSITNGFTSAYNKLTQTISEAATTVKQN